MYVARDGALWEVSVDGSPERRLMELAGKRGSLVIPDSHASDGRYLYFSWREHQGDIWVMDVVQDDGSDD